ncbi:MAG: alpha/beta hydrolase [Cytophagales bacterium]|nr:alpha/beta hydrolase [Cytophagales bacterium]
MSLSKYVRLFFRLGAILAVFVVVVFITDGCVQFRDTTATLQKYFGEKKLKPLIKQYKAQGRDIRYLSIGDDTSATVLFIHGAPSSMSYFKEYLSDSVLLRRTRMLAVDRPGYGYSGFGLPLTSIEQQARMIRPVLDSLSRKSHPVVLVGTSYGTSVACRLAMDYPHLVDGIVLVAPALAPGEERIYGISYPMESPLLKWMVPRMLKSANAEKLSHYEELEKMLPLWKNIKVPVIYLQGQNDDLIYTTNAEFARKQLVNVPSLDITLIPNRGHLIAFSEKDLIQKSILKMLDKVNKPVAPPAIATQKTEAAGSH